MPKPKNDYEIERELALEEAKLGIEAESFLRSNLGRYLLDRVDVEVAQLRDELEDADPEDEKENRRIRLEIKVRRLLPKWIGEAIGSGRRAQGEIEDDPRELEPPADY